MDEKRDKAGLIKENIESTIGNAMETAEELYNTDDFKKQRELLDKNSRRAQAVNSMIRELKVEEAKKELESDDNNPQNIS